MASRRPDQHRKSTSLSPAVPGRTSLPEITAVNAGDNQAFTGTASATTAHSGPTANTRCRQRERIAGNPVAVFTQIQGVVNSVDLTQSPPLLSIGGQTYTVSQIKGIVN